MSIQYTTQGFEPTTFRMWVSSHNHQTRASLGTPSGGQRCTIVIYDQIDKKFAYITTLMSTPTWFNYFSVWTGPSDSQMGSGCGSVCRAVASDSRGLRYESSHRQKFILNNYCRLYLIDKNKEKEAWSGPSKIYLPLRKQIANFRMIVT